ncbi:fetuin-B [Oryzias latipes]|uniref:Fetuin B n=1 Tax=Oryzias latipes TaxID=8090 RepID=H2MAG7_ORYLA|nr:fetuin-B [Oryzias latipes]
MMKICILGLLVLGCVHGAPVKEDLKPQSCDDPHAVKAAHVALTKINMERNDGYIFSLHRLSNVHHSMHGENGVVYYLTMDVVETNCSVLSRKDWKHCEARPTSDQPVYGQCKAAIFINKVHRVDRLYKYDCVIKPVPSARVSALCPDCPTLISPDNEQVQKTLSLSLDKFNKESGLKNRFDKLKITRARAGMAMQMYYIVEYTIQETTCAHNTEGTEKCPLMTCEFAHKGFCKASLYSLPDNEQSINVECEIYEPEASEREKKAHLLGGETDHSHNDTHGHDHSTLPDHDHAHDHTKVHHHHNKTHEEADSHDHHHSHDHKPGSAYRHSHDHSHEHGVNHDHEHSHHTSAHNHTGDFPNHHHDYKHAEGVHTHDHDHELALDHEHKHAHLHDHEHHHHHHGHGHETTPHDTPVGSVRVLTDGPMILPSFPDQPAAGPHPGVTLPLRPDPQIPGAHEPIIQAFPRGISHECKAPEVKNNLVDQLFAEDPTFKPSA